MQCAQSTTEHEHIQKYPTFQTTKIIFIHRKTSSHNSYKYSQLNAFTSSLNGQPTQRESQNIN